MESSRYYVSALILIALPLLYKLIKSRRRQNLPPGPLALPVIGHLHLLKEPLYDYLRTVASRFGPNLFLRFGRIPVFITSSPAVVEECFTKNDLALADRPKSMAGDHFTYNYTFLVWAPHGPHWRTIRRVTHTEIFSLKALQKSAYVREEEVQGLVYRLFKASGTPANGRSEKHKMDMRHLMTILTSNIVMKVAAGRPCVEDDEVDTDEGKRLLQEFKDLFFPIVALTLCDFLPLFRWIRYKGIEQSMATLHQRRDVFMRALMDETRTKLDNVEDEKIKAVDSTKASVAEILMHMQKTEPEFYTDDVIKGIVMMMFIAGTETSTYTLEWALSLLLNHPKALQKTKDEIDSQVGHDRLVTDADLARLPYLRAVVKETLRMFPPAPLLLPHWSIDPCTLGGYDIPKGTMVMVNAWAMHRDPEYWEEPEKFMPERFESFSGEPREGFMYAPFGVGRRACPGGNMGTQVVTLAMGALIQCFDWAAIGGKEDLAHRTGGVSLSKVKPLECLCSPRPELLRLLRSL